jgi:signal transduction histidine kinase
VVVAGHGIIGMRERAAMLGGQLDAGPTDDGGFLVTAVLPDAKEPAEEPR